MAAIMEEAITTVADGMAAVEDLLPAAEAIMAAADGIIKVRQIGVFIHKLAFSSEFGRWASSLLNRQTIAA